MLGQDELGAEAAPGGGVHHLHHRLRCEAERLTDRERLDRDGVRRSRGEVVERLHRVARPERAGAEEPLAQDLEHGSDAGDGIVLAADHQRQRRALGPGDTAGDRGVDETDAELGESCAESLCSLRIGAAHVDDNGAGGERRGDAAPPVEHRLPHSGIVGEHRDHRPHAGECAGAVGHLACMRRGEARGLLRVGVVHDEPVTGPYEVSCHRPAHPAESHEADRGLLGCAVGHR